MDRPKHADIEELMETMKRWEGMARSKNKKKAAMECARVYKVLKYFNEHNDLRIGR